MGRPNLNAPTIDAIRLALPPPEETGAIVAELDRRLSILDRLEATIEQNLERAKHLRQAILKRAFEGRLVPQDPSDEPASVLLERIRKERGAAGVEGKARRGRGAGAKPAKAAGPSGAKRGRQARLPKGTDGDAAGA